MPAEELALPRGHSSVSSTWWLCLQHGTSPKSVAGTSAGVVTAAAPAAPIRGGNGVTTAPWLLSIPWQLAPALTHLGEQKHIPKSPNTPKYLCSKVLGLQQPQPPRAGSPCEQTGTIQFPADTTWSQWSGWVWPAWF